MAPGLSCHLAIEPDIALPGLGELIAGLLQSHGLRHGLHDVARFAGSRSPSGARGIDCRIAPIPWLTPWAT